MIYNFNVKLLAGGTNSIAKTWTKNVDGKDNCFKIYRPLKGKAAIEIENNIHSLTPGNIYFFSGWHIKKQLCEDFMKTSWVHFVPDSLLLQHILLVSGVFCKISIQQHPSLLDGFTDIQEVFMPYDGFLTKKPQIKFDVPDYLICRLKGTVLSIISTILKKHDYTTSANEATAMQRLQKAIDYMDNSYLDNPKLSIIAKKVNMAPNYFHNVFKKEFGLTPFEYMLNKRIAFAKELLGFSCMNIKEIAEHTGYGDEFYFSRIFKKSTGLSPAKFRKQSI